MLEFIEATKTYNNQRILQIPYLQMPSGNSWLHGANGSGKTTLLKMIAGLIPLSGDILLYGKSLSREPVAYRRMVSWADAEPQFPGFMRGQELLDYFVAVRKANAALSLSRAERLGIRPMLSQFIDSYSSGMLKKLSLLLAFTGDTRLICLDEPLTTLDAESIPAVFAIIDALKRQQGVSFLISSHQQLPAELFTPDQQYITIGKTLQPL